MSTSLEDALRWLEEHGTKKTLREMGRYGIPSGDAFGVTVGETKAYAKQIGRDHELAQALWESGWYEARLLAAFIDEPEKVTIKQMNQWAGDFDSWAVCDTICFHLFDRTRHAWSRVRVWAKAKPEFKKRGAYALLWGLSVHDREAPDESFLECLPLLESGAADERDYVKKGVDMALRAIGKRNAPLHASALSIAERLKSTGSGPQAWVGRRAAKELASSKVRSKVRGESTRRSRR